MVADLSATRDVVADLSARCFSATCRDHQRSLTCLWDIDAAMFNAKAGRSLDDARDNKNRPSSTITGYMNRYSRVHEPL